DIMTIEKVEAFSIPYSSHFDDERNEVAECQFLCMLEKLETAKRPKGSLTLPIAMPPLVNCVLKELRSLRSRRRRRVRPSKKSRKSRTKTWSSSRGSSPP